MGYEQTKAWRESMDPAELRARRAEEARRYRETHPDKVKAIKDRHRARNADAIREADKVRQRAYRQTDKYREAERARHARHKAKIAAEREAIAGRPKPDACELCGGSDFAIVWDHCHVHGHFRGWICDRCNRTLGLVKDSAALLRKMAMYLDETAPIGERP